LECLAAGFVDLKWKQRGHKSEWQNRARKTDVADLMLDEDSPDVSFVTVSDSERLTPTSSLPYRFSTAARCNSRLFDVRQDEDGPEVSFVTESDSIPTSSLPYRFSMAARCNNPRHYKKEILPRHLLCRPEMETERPSVTSPSGSG
jgi:hypothetical protein